MEYENRMETNLKINTDLGRSRLYRRREERAVDDKLWILERVPQNIREKLKVRKYSYGEFIGVRDEKKLYLILDGTVAFCRYQKDRKVIFPYLFKRGVLLGLRFYFDDKQGDWEHESFSDDTKVLEIPRDILKNYIFNDEEIFGRIMKDCLKIMGIAFRGVYIHAQGGAKAYFAYLLYLNSGESRRIILKQYSILTSILTVNRAHLYKMTRELTEKALIAQDKNVVEVLDRDGLREYFEDYIYDEEM